jgi:hypothetical protein
MNNDFDFHLRNPQRAVKKAGSARPGRSNVSASLGDAQGKATFDRIVATPGGTPVVV